MEIFLELLEKINHWSLKGVNWWQFAVIIPALFFARLASNTIKSWIALINPDEIKQEGIGYVALQTAMRLAWPASFLVWVLVGREIMRSLELPHLLLNIAVPLLMSLVVIRFTIYIVRKSFVPSPLLKHGETFFSTTIWLIVGLHLVGWLEPVLEGLDSLAISFGAIRLSLLGLINLLLLVSLALILAIWVSRFIERQLASSRILSASMKVGASKFSRYFLIIITLLVVLNQAGIDLTAFAVFGGALGVGLGFGLQRIASNFISGFILLLDRSIKPGDVISINDKYGWVQQMHARFIVVRNRDGVDTLIPNETFISSQMINWSYSDRNVRIKIKVQVSYDDDPEKAMDLMLECASASPRVLSDPAPSARLLNFGDNGIDLELRVWINDPENGSGGIRSDINRAIWRKFKEEGISIPYPQRDLYLKSVPPELMMCKENAKNTKNESCPSD